MAVPMFFKLDTQTVDSAWERTRWIPGDIMLVNMPRMAITTSSSTRVKAGEHVFTAYGQDPLRLLFANCNGCTGLPFGMGSSYAWRG